MIRFCLDTQFTIIYCGNYLHESLAAYRYCKVYLTLTVHNVKVSYLRNIDNYNTVKLQSIVIF